MSSESGIEWTDWTWNPITGCTKVSEGCDNCYAATLSRRLLGPHYTKRLPVVDTAETRIDPFSLRLWPERLADPLLISKSSMIFVNSMSDLFHVDVPPEYIREVFQVMVEAGWHTFQVLTKRPGRAARFLEHNADLFPGRRVPPHIWIGTSVENQAAAFRVAQLRTIPAEIRFLSCEPLLGPLDLDLRDLDWVIVGGESGPVRRVMDLDWARSIRSQAEAAGVPFFFKQVGGRTPKAGGRMLDGRTWDGYPKRPLAIAG